MSLPPLPKASKGGRQFSLQTSDHERLLTMIIALAAEVSTLQDKLDNLTQVAAASSGFKPEAVEAYMPNPEQAAERSRKRQAFVERILRIVYADFERASDPSGMSYDDILAMVAGESENT